MREMMSHFDLSRDATHGQTEMRQRVPGVRVASVLRHDNIRREGDDQRRQQRFDHLDIRIVLGEWFERHIDRVAAPQAMTEFKHIPRAGKKVTPRFMQRDSHNARLIVESTLHPIAMMGIEIDIENLRLARPQHMGNGYGTIVIHTKTRSAVYPGMMQSSPRMKDMQGPLLFRRERSPFRQSHHRA